MTTLSPVHRSRTRWLIADTLALTGRSVRHELRHLDGLLTTIMLPVVILFMFVYVFGGVIEIPGGTYVDYVVPGIVLLTAGYGAALTASAINLDLTTGTIDRLRSMPASPAALFGGHVTAVLLRTLVSTTLVVLVAVAIGFRPVTDPLPWLGALGIASLFIATIAWLAVAAGILARSPEAASGFSFVVLFLPYVSSAFVPTETLPAALRPFAEHQPVTPVIETMRALLMGTPVGTSAWRAVAWCLALLAIAVPASAVLFRRRTRR